jgi:hypothetical protein
MSKTIIVETCDGCPYGEMTARQWVYCRHQKRLLGPSGSWNPMYQIHPECMLCDGVLQ